VKYDKSYINDLEAAHRYNIFKSSLDFIEDFNSNPERTFTVGITRFADLTNEEYRKQLSGVIRRANPSLTSSSVKNSALPVAVDWRQKHAVTSVKDQLQCGSSPFFAAVGSIGKLCNLTCINTI
jgi:KDEL-tailed cysteine endopeptidase